MSAYKESKKRERLKGRSSSSQKSEPGFIFVPAVVIRSAAYTRLSSYARALLCELSTLYRPAGDGNNGSLCIAFSVFEPLNWKRSRFYKSVDELVDAGFIVITRTGGNRIASYCALTWHKIGPPMKKVGQYDPHVVVGSTPHKPWIKPIADHPNLAARLSKKAAADAEMEASAKNAGVATQPEISKSGCQTTRLPPSNMFNGLPGSTLESFEPQESGCDAAPYKNFCHGQRAFKPPGDTECSAQQESEAEGVKVQEDDANHQLETAVTQFRALLIVGGIGPETAERRVRKTLADCGAVNGIRFMRDFVELRGPDIREWKKATRTSGALAAAVKNFKPDLQVA